jgi:hypothetical protein
LCRGAFRAVPFRVFCRTVFYNKNRTPLDNMIRMSREKLRWRQGDSLADMFEQDAEAKSEAGTEKKYLSSIAMDNVSTENNQSWERKKYKYRHRRSLCPPLLACLLFCLPPF